MEERELLERAAKAAGIYLYVDADGVSFKLNEGGIPYNGLKWNPLTDDGDALRLAVKLGMTVNVENDIGAVAANAGWVDGEYWPEMAAATESIDNDPFAATRRAIVRAAAILPSLPPPMEPGIREIKLPPLPEAPSDAMKHCNWDALSSWAYAYATRAVMKERERAVEPPPPLPKEPA